MHNSCVEDGGGNKKCVSAWQEFISNDTELGKYLKAFSDKAGIPKLLKVSQKVSDYLGLAQEISVCFDDFGFPDFLPYAKIKDANGNWVETVVDIDDMQGNESSDFTKARDKLCPKLGIQVNDCKGFDFHGGSGKTVEISGLKYTWHHHQDGKHMMLVPFDIHSKIGHNGGKKLAELTRLSKGNDPKNFTEYRGLVPSPWDIAKDFLNCK